MPRNSPIIGPMTEPTATVIRGQSLRGIASGTSGKQNLPRNGAAAKALIAMPRCSAGIMSAITPPALVIGDDPNAPAKNRRMIRDQLFCALAAPQLNAVKAQYVLVKRSRRPNSSLSGANSKLLGSQQTGKEQASRWPDLPLGLREGFSVKLMLACVPPKAKVDRLISKVLQLTGSSRMYVPYCAECALARTVAREKLTKTVGVSHGPALQEEYEHFWNDPTTVRLSWLSILFSIVCLATGILLQSGGPTQCLVLGVYTKPTAYSVDALLLYLYSEFLPFEDTQLGLDVVLATIVRGSMRMGYHRNPSHYPYISIFAGEMRRPMWALLIQLDILVSLQVGLPQMINERDSDTQPPRKCPRRGADSGHDHAATLSTGVRGIGWVVHASKDELSFRARGDPRPCYIGAPGAGTLTRDGVSSGSDEVSITGLAVPKAPMRAASATYEAANSVVLGDYASTPRLRSFATNHTSIAKPALANSRAAICGKLPTWVTYGFLLASMLLSGPSVGRQSEADCFVGNRLAPTERALRSYSPQRATYVGASERGRRNVLRGTSKAEHGDYRSDRPCGGFLCIPFPAASDAPGGTFLVARQYNGAPFQISMPSTQSIGLTGKVQPREFYVASGASFVYMKATWDSHLQENGIYSQLSSSVRIF
ncbi:hypothetical protein BDW71DRAFT_208680 [Aspergillus fruticulosus]